MGKWGLSDTIANDESFLSFGQLSFGVPDVGGPESQTQVCVHLSMYFEVWMYVCVLCLCVCVYFLTTAGSHVSENSCICGARVYFRARFCFFQFVFSRVEPRARPGEMGWGGVGDIDVLFGGSCG